MLKGKKIVLGITGSIAAYKACLIIRGLVKAGAEVQVVITPAGKEFITPITLSALTHKPVISEFFAQRDGTWNSHVDLGLWADAMLIAPCTASTLGKMANGIADNMLITTYLSMKAPVFIAPAMDLDMYKHPSTQENMKRLVSFGNTIIEPASGFLASGLEGKGRMEEPERIVEILEEELGEAPSKKRGSSGDSEEESQGEAPSKKRGSSGDSEEEGLTLKLVPNPDIAAALGKMKREGQVMVGFALETNDEEVNAKKKLEKKNLDFIVLNSLQNKGTCFQSDENQISIISKEGQRDYEKKSKQEVARDIVEELERRLKDEGRRKR